MPKEIQKEIIEWLQHFVETPHVFMGNKKIAMRGYINEKQKEARRLLEKWRNSRARKRKQSIEEKLKLIDKLFSMLMEQQTLENLANIVEEWNKIREELCQSFSTEATGQQSKSN